MPLPTIAIVNFSSLPDQEVQDPIRAVNRQVTEDFMPIWGHGRILKLHAASFDPADPDSLTEEPVQADSVIYLVDESSPPGALGYHDMNSHENPSWVRLCSCRRLDHYPFPRGPRTHCRSHGQHLLTRPRSSSSGRLKPMAFPFLRGLRCRGAGQLRHRPCSGFQFRDA